MDKQDEQDRPPKGSDWLIFIAVCALAYLLLSIASWPVP